MNLQSQFPFARIVAGIAAAIVILLAIAIAVGRGDTSANQVTISGNMEGALDIDPGDWVAAGYFLKMNDRHDEATIFVVDATVTIHVTCRGGGEWGYRRSP